VTDDGLIREYLRSAPDTFWEWGEGGDVITWKDGRTIAFRDELRTVLAWLAPQGLPSLDSIALLLAATHDSWDANRDDTGILLLNILDSFLSSPQQRALLQDVLSGLDRVRQLDSELRMPVRSKAVLTEVVLSRCRKLAEPDVATSIVEAIRRGLGELLAPPEVDIQSRGYGPVLLLRDMADMLHGLRQLDADKLRLRLDTGLEELPGRAEVELSPAEVARSMLDTLRDDVEFAGLSRVAKQLLAVASLPRRLDADEPYHTGGFSDISNRGSMERLLISELANDDLTLAVRVAMNEALYLRREVPPSTPHNHRAVLIDAGIRSWGVPRVFATAVALALMAGTAKGGTYSCYRAKRDAVQLANLTTRNGLVEHLSALETELHPAAAIPAYLQQIKEDAHVEPIFVMTEDALADDAMQQALRGINLPQVFIATVNREGVFRLSERGKHGVKPLREAKIDIGELFREPTSVIAKDRTSDLPAIFGREPFPLLLGEKVARDRAFFVQGWGILSTTGDGRLLRWRLPRQGARQISDQIVGRILWIAPAAVDGIVALVAGGSNNASLMYVNEQNLVVGSAKLKPSAAGERYCARNGVLFFIRPGAVDAMDMHTGDITNTLRLPGDVQWVRDRFFRGPRGIWYALSYDGHSARLEPVECAGDRRELPPLITMFDQVGVDGPVGVTRQGSLISTATGNVRQVRHDLSDVLAVPWISADGRRLHLMNLAQTFFEEPGVLVNTEHLDCPSANAAILDDRARHVVRPVNLRHRFKMIGLDAAGNLALESRKGQILAFEVRQRLPVLAVRGDRTPLRAARGFEDLMGTGKRYRLSQARWADGSRAVLDGRGLLHLTSSDRAIPEVTLVLAEGELTGWCSDGRMWGKRYFIGDARVRDESAAAQYSIFHATVARFAERINA